MDCICSESLLIRSHFALNVTETNRNTAQSADSDASARRIYEDADATQQLTGFFDEIASPLLSNVEVSYESNAVVESGSICDL
jgi:hypothetical protein